MRYNGRELISRPTRASGRTLLLSSFAFILVISNGGVDPNGITILSSLEFGPSTVQLGGIALLAYLLAAHLVNFYGDILSYYKWNHPKQILGAIVNFDQGAELTTELGDAIKSLNEIVDSLANSNVDGLSDKDSGTLAQVCSQLKDIKAGHRSLSRFAWYTMLGWFAAIPVGVGILTLLLVFTCM